MKSRTYYSMINSSISAVVYIIKMVVGFVARSFFIAYLGSKYLGLNGLYTNILTFLSLAELGVGTSIVYELYKPLADNDHERIKSWMALYQKAYTIIGLVVAAAGLCVLPFLHLFIKGDVPHGNIYTFYVLFLANSVVSYFFTYKRSLINADQKNYRTVINDFVFYAITQVVQIALLITTHDYMFFLIVQIVATLASNISISVIADRTYPFLREKNVQPLPAGDRKHLLMNVAGNVTGQIGTIVVQGSDNILISGFVGLTAVGLYSNYTMVTMALKSLTGQITNSVTSSIGNLIASGDKERHYSTFKQYLFINSSLAFICGMGLMGLLNPFITIWIGADYLLPIRTTMLIALYTVIYMYQNSARNFINAYGLFWQQRWKPIFESILNVAFSLFFLMVLHLGIEAVLLGTICSALSVIMWYEPYVVYKYGLKREIKGYALKTVFFYAKLAVGFTALFFLQQWLPTHGFASFMVYGVAAGVCTLVLYVAFFGFAPEFRQLGRRIGGMLARRK